MTRYNSKYEYFRLYGAPTHVWTLVGALGAVHLRITESRESCDPQHTGGIEIHRRQSPDGSAPDHDPCSILHGPCWTSGSALAVEEKWIPLWEQAPRDHDGMFRRLATMADEIFEADD